MSAKTIITSLIWIKKGFAKSIPLEYEFEEDQIKEQKKLEQKLKAKGNLTGKETIKEATIKLENQLENLDLKEEDQTPIFCDEFKNYYQNKDDQENNEDAQYPEGFDDLSDEEQEDFTIHPTDSIIACATAQDDISNIEVYIFDENTQSLYVHHDIILSTYPLCVEWLPINSQSNTKANYAIVGSFLPEIEIWNLDLLDAVDPDFILGKTDDDQKYFKNLKKKKNKISSNNEFAHSDSVMTLNVNPFNNLILASGGADSKILFWDLNTSKAIKSIKEHKDKVQIVRWNKTEDNVLISGSYDKTIKLFDVRSNTSATTIETSAEIECLDWSGLNKYLFLSSYDNGKIDLYDIRKFDTLVSYQAHKKAVTSVSFSNQQDGLFSSVSLDSHVKIWDSVNAKAIGDSVVPNLLCEKFIKKTTGELFVTKFADDVDYTIAVGGSKGELFIWQLEENPIFCNRYKLNWEEEKTPNEFNNISKKRMMTNRLHIKKNK